MPKKRRPHKPAPSHRPPAQAVHAPDARAASPVEPVRADDASGIAVEAREAAGAVMADHAADAQPAAAPPPAHDAGADFPVATPSGPGPVQGDARPTVQPAEPAAAAARPAASDIRGVLIQVAGARLLLPNATIAEVLSYADPEPVGGEAPDWLLGRMRWRGWQLPLVAFGRLAGVADEKAALGSKVVVLKALAGTGRTPYFALLTQGFPRLVTVSRGALELEDDNAEAMPRGVQARVRLNENDALLPDLEAIEALVSQALEQAAQAA